MIDSLRAGGAGLLQLEIGDFIETDPRKGSLANAYILDQLEAAGPAALVPGPRELSRWSDVRKLLAGRAVRTVLSNVQLPEVLAGPQRIPASAVLTIGGVRVGLLGVIGADEFAQIDWASELLPEFRDPAGAIAALVPALRAEAEIVIVMACMNDRDAERLAEEVSGVDVLISGYESIACRDAYRAGQAVYNRSGMRGQYFSYIRTIISPSGELVEWWGRNLRLDGQVPADPEIEREVLEIKAAQTRTSTFGAQKRPPRVGRQGERYLGVITCRACHPDPYAQWLDTPHAHATATLDRDDHRRDPACLRCHTTGYEHLSGYRISASEPDLANVQCESCHGIGSEHRRGAERPSVCEATCRTCHTDEWSPEWDFETYRARSAHR